MNQYQSVMLRGHLYLLTLVKQR